MVCSWTQLHESHMCKMILKFYHQIKYKSGHCKNTCPKFYILTKIKPLQVFWKELDQLLQPDKFYGRDKLFKKKRKTKQKKNYFSFFGTSEPLWKMCNKDYSLFRFYCCKMLQSISEFSQFVNCFFFSGCLSVLLNGLIYLVGGRTRDVHVYDPAADKTLQVASLNEIHMCTGVTVIEGKCTFELVYLP